MRHLLLNPIALRGLFILALGRAALRYKNRRRREIDRHRRAFYENAWREAAAELGASWKSLGAGFAEIELGSVRTRVGPGTCELEDRVSSDIMVDKRLTSRLLENEGLPTPRSLSFSFSDVSPAVQFLKSSSRPCVVKPAAGTGGGRGVTTGIRTEGQLARAVAAAAVYGDDLLLEQQVEGNNYRLLYLNGELMDAFVRQPPKVVGDGRSTVAALVRKANEERLRHGATVSQVLLTVDLEMRHTLAAQGLTLASTPSAGQTIILKNVINENAGADNSTATQHLCPSIVEAGSRAAAALRARLAGVDIITRDPSLALAETGGVILEVNSPNFYYHYHKRDGSFPVALHVLKCLLAQPTGENTFASAAAAGRFAGSAV